MHNVLHMEFDASFNTDGNPAATAGLLITYVVIYFVFAFILSRVFKKAGQAGILAVIPIVNSIVLLKIAGRNPWSVLLYLIPVVGFIWSIMVAQSLGKSFGKGGAFSFFLLVWPLPFIGYLILAFGKSTYNEAAVAA